MIATSAALAAAAALAALLPTATTMVRLPPHNTTSSIPSCDRAVRARV